MQKISTFVNTWKTKVGFLAMSLLFVGLISVPAVQADNGYTWTDSNSPAAHGWLPVASSSDGSRLVAAAYGGDIYTSSDYGATWTDRTSAGSLGWVALASSSDGKYLVASDDDPGNIYTSSDYGASWTKQTAAGSQTWQALASSSDGSRIVAAASGGSIYTSSDYGATWTRQTAAGSRSWRSVASSSDGSRLVAVVRAGSIYTSSDYGATWTEQASAGARQWNSVASSSDGKYLAAVVRSGGDIYTSSDYGATWTDRTSAGAGNWYAIASSSDGSRLVAAMNPGNIYTSVDYGATWTKQNDAGTRNWYSVTSNSDGSRVAAADNSSSTGSIWTAHNPDLVDTGGGTPGGGTPGGGSSGEDLNGDGVDDSQQSNVVGLTNKLTGKPAALEVHNTCSLSDVAIKSETEVATSTSYQFPLGMFDFNATCGAPGFTTTVTQYFYDSPTDNYAAVKYMNGKYEAVSGATITTQTIHGQKVLVVSYQVKDGGPLDADGTVNGVIVDPAGPAVTSKAPNTPNTGYGVSHTNPLATLLTYGLGAATLLGLALVSRKLAKK